MGKVAYLFGAGASANCVPIVKHLPGALDDFKNKVRQNMDRSEKKDYPVSKARKGLTWGMVEEEFIEELQVIIKGCESHASIDTYAKKLFITQDPTYGKLKAILSCYFIYVQYLRKIDHRYDTFFASILGENSTQFLGNITIVSWNYDFQFEKAYSNYSLKKEFAINQQRLSVHPGPMKLDMRHENFSILKINGTTGFYDQQKGAYTHIPATFELKSEFDLIQDLINMYGNTVHVNDSYSTTLSFAWEYPSSIFRETTNTAIKAIKDAESIVIIGYSFPFFNRDIDKQIFSSIADKAKIYIQDLTPVNIEARVSSYKKKLQPVILIPDTEQFFLPPEL